MTYPKRHPSARTYSHGEYAVSRHRFMNGADQRMLHCDSKTRQQLKLNYDNCSLEQFDAFISHFNSVKGTHGAFRIAEDVFTIGWATDSGDTTLLGMNLMWRYASEPRIRSRFHGTGTLEVQLETVPGHDDDAQVVLTEEAPSLQCCPPIGSNGGATPIPEVEIPPPGPVPIPLPDELDPEVPKNWLISWDRTTEKAPRYSCSTDELKNTFPIYTNPKALFIQNIVSVSIQLRFAYFENVCGSPAGFETVYLITIFATQADGQVIEFNQEGLSNGTGIDPAEYNKGVPDTSYVANLKIEVNGVEIPVPDSLKIPNQGISTASLAAPFSTESDCYACPTPPAPPGSGSGSIGGGLGGATPVPNDPGNNSSPTPDPSPTPNPEPIGPIGPEPTPIPGPGPGTDDGGGGGDFGDPAGSEEIDFGCGIYTITYTKVFYYQQTYQCRNDAPTVPLIEEEVNEVSGGRSDSACGYRFSYLGDCKIIDVCDGPDTLESVQQLVVERKESDGRWTMVTASQASRGNRYVQGDSVYVKDPGRGRGIYFKGITLDFAPYNRAAESEPFALTSSEAAGISNFPNISPSRRLITYGDHLIDRYGDAVEVTHPLPSTAEKSDVVMDLTFANRDDKIARYFFNHYDHTLGGFHDFALYPVDPKKGTFAGWDAPEANDVRQGRWIYAAPPRVTQTHIGTSTVSVRLLNTQPRLLPELFDPLVPYPDSNGVFPIPTPTPGGGGGDGGDGDGSPTPIPEPTPDPDQRPTPIGPIGPTPTPSPGPGPGVPTPEPEPMPTHCDTIGWTHVRFRYKGGINCDFEKYHKPDDLRITYTGYIKNNPDNWLMGEPPWGRESREIDGRFYFWWRNVHTYNIVPYCNSGAVEQGGYQYSADPCIERGDPSMEFYTGPTSHTTLVNNFGTRYNVGIMPRVIYYNDGPPQFFGPSAYGGVSAPSGGDPSNEWWKASAIQKALAGTDEAEGSMYIDGFQFQLWVPDFYDTEPYIWENSRRDRWRENGEGGRWIDVDNTWNQGTPGGAGTSCPG